jgi:hypothetical protein
MIRGSVDLFFCRLHCGAHAVTLTAKSLILFAAEKCSHLFSVPRRISQRKKLGGLDLRLPNEADARLIAQQRPNP